MKKLTTLEMQSTQGGLFLAIFLISFAIGVAMGLIYQETQY
jgi:hypothetical protein